MKPPSASRPRGGSPRAPRRPQPMLGALLRPAARRAPRRARPSTPRPRRANCRSRPFGAWLPSRQAPCLAADEERRFQVEIDCSLTLPRRAASAVDISPTDDSRTSLILVFNRKTEGRATSYSLHKEPDTNPPARIREAGHDNWPPTRQTPDTNGGETERGKSPSPAPLARGAADDAANIIRDQDRATRDRQTTPAMAADNPPTTHDSKLTDNRVRIKTAHDDRNIQLTGYVLLNPPRRSNPDNQLRCIEDNTRHHLGRRGRSRQGCRGPETQGHRMPRVPPRSSLTPALAGSEDQTPQIARS